MNKRIVMLNASGLKEFSCKLKFYRTVFEGYTDTARNISMDYGTGFHLFVAQMNKSNGDYPSAIQLASNWFDEKNYVAKASKKYMTRQHLIRCCMEYWEYYNQKGKKDEWQTVREPEALVEQKFAIPYYVDDYVEVILCGTIDDICKRDNGCYAIRDYKTTSVWDKTTYLAHYNLDPQLLFYVFVLYEYAKLYPDSIFKTICSKGRVAAFIDGIFLKEKEITFQRSDMFFFTDRQIGEFKQTIDQYVIPEISRMAQADTIPLKEGVMNGVCHNVFGPCKYSIACSMPDDTSAGHILNNNFTKKPYNPLNYEA